ncbi:hypothetical protein CA13_02330 [Planctomycetes bacterium CA13]|uniref:Transposase DDE domain-containing protein n=2 Tax=Novipirellula herctigrandis TaxID=2527986 RepID=A0A5C5YVP2_9BACT|nr:hypothetical protein CA13_02330 [Planctomycetes bacterium CA13]
MPAQRKIYTCDRCADCPLAARCRRNRKAKRGREVMHDEQESARRRHRMRMKNDEAQTAYWRRQHISETPLAVMKAMFDMRRLSLRRLSLRGIERVGQQWRGAPPVFNLKKSMNVWAELRCKTSETPISARN